MSGARKILQPATLEPSGSQRNYRPRLPWKWIALVGSVIGLFSVIHLATRWQDVQSLRRAIAEAHAAHVATPASRIRAFRSQLERHIGASARGTEFDLVDPQFDLLRLRDAHGVYLRIPLSEAQSPQTVASAARAMGPDAITRCLGISPISLRGLYTHSDVLQRSWIENALKVSSLMPLRALQEQLRMFVGRDLPPLINLLRSDYFFLVLEEGEDRAHSPVRVFLWNLHNGEPLLKARLQGNGYLLPVQVALGGERTRSGGAQRSRESLEAVDCSIAAALRDRL